MSLVTAISGGLTPVPPSGAQVQQTGFGSDWPVYHQDGLGSGVDPAGTNLAPAAPAWTSPVLDGQLYGEPLVEGGRVIVATENDSVYALAANSGAVMWSTHIATPVPSSDLPCGDIGPTVGITSTPVIDPAEDEVFVVADELTAGNNASHHLIGVNLFTGAIVLDTPVDPPGSHPLYQLQRPGLALDAGKVMIGFGGNSGDCETPANPYHGWLVAVPEGGGPMQTFEVASNTGDSQGAVWMGGAAPIVDGSGNIWVATGNSAFESATDPYDNSDGVLELNSNLQLEQSFAPSHWYNDNSSDFDLGSSSPALMADGLLLQAGKSQIAYVTSQSSLGGVGGQLASAGSYCGATVDGGSAVAGNDVYTPCRIGVVKTQVTPGDPPTISSVWQTSSGSGGPPIMASGLIWTIRGDGILYGLDPATGDPSQDFNIGTESNHFPTPSVADGLLLAPASQTVHAFDGPAGLPPPPTMGPPPPAAGGLASVTPARIVDSRVGLGVAGALAPGQTATFPVAGRGGVPVSGAGAVALNVTVTSPQQNGFLTVFPAGGARPVTSSVNFGVGQTVGDLVLAQLGTGGAVSVYNGSGGSVQIVGDVSGWFASGSPAAGGLASVTPARIVDSRVGLGVPAALAPGQTATFPVAGRGGVPVSGAGAVALNVTVTSPQQNGFLTVFPAGGARPVTSSVNFGVGQTVGDLVLAQLGTGGAVSVYNGSGGSVQVVGDVSGWFASGSPAAGGLASVTPARIVDSRVGLGVAGALAPGQTATFPVAGRGGVPVSGAGAVALNVTVTSPQQNGFLTVFPAGEARPVTSSVNFGVGQTVGDLVLAQLGTGGAVSVYNGSGGSVQIVGDVSGWFSGGVS